MITGGSEKLQNLASLRGKITDLFVSCNEHQMDRLKALKYLSHGWFVGQLMQLIRNSRISPLTTQRSLR